MVHVGVFHFFSPDAVNLFFCKQHQHRYGDVTPKSDLGRLVVAIYAVLVLNAVGGLLGVSREYLESFCRTKIVDREESGPKVEGAEKATDGGKETKQAATETKKDK